MKCHNCPKTASFICKCTNILLCPDDLGPHLLSRSNIKHQHEPLHQSLEPYEFLTVNKELKERVSILKKLKKKINTETNMIIKTLANHSKAYIQIISNLINQYEALLKQEENAYENIEELKTLAVTEIVIKPFDSSKIVEEIKSLYSKQIISFEADTCKEMLMKKNKLLQTYNSGFYRIAVTNDRKILVAGSLDGTIRVWDIINKRQICCLFEHKSVVRSLAISKNDLLLLSGSDDKIMIL